MKKADRTKDLRSVRREQRKRAGLLPTYRFRSQRIPNKRRQAERDACRTTVQDDELE